MLRCLQILAKVLTDIFRQVYTDVRVTPVSCFCFLKRIFSSLRHVRSLQTTSASVSTRARPHASVPSQWLTAVLIVNVTWRHVSIAKRVRTKIFLIIILFNLSILFLKSGCSCSNGPCRDSSCPCFQFAFRCSSNCQCASCLNAQATADISLFVVRESRIEGAGAGVFLSHSSALPSDFLITGTFVSMNCFKISYVFFQNTTVIG